MPAKNRKQQQAAAIAYAVKTGQLPKSKLRGASLQMYKSMSIEELYKFASERKKHK